jgi:hypothetical protein
MASHDSVANAGQHISYRISKRHVISTSGLPRRLDNAGDLARQCQLAETNTTQAEAADEPTRASATLTAIPNLHGMFAAQLTILHTFLCHG